MNIHVPIAISDFYRTLRSNKECHSSTTPEALIDEARCIITDLTVNHKEILRRSLDWLIAPVKESIMMEGIRGRAYTAIEKDTLAVQRDVVRRIPCSFYLPDGQCLLATTRPLSCRVTKEEYANMAGNLALKLRRLGSTTEWGFLPALIAAELDRQNLIALIQEGRVADAKIALVKRPEVEAVATQKI